MSSPIVEAPVQTAAHGLLSPAQNLTPHAPRPEALPLPTGVAEALWRGDSLGRASTATWPSGFAALDAELPGGGWPSRQLTEVLQPQFSLAEWRLVGPALRGVVATGAPVVMVGPPRLPHLPGLMHLGLDQHHLVWIQAQAAAERLWSTEQLIKSNAAGAVLAWLPQAMPEQVRRLQVLAQSFDGPVFLFRPLQARHDPSSAPLRLTVEVDLDWQLRVNVFKRKGPALDEPLLLPSVPGGLDLVLTPRVMRPSTLLPVAPPVTVATPDTALTTAPVATTATPSSPIELPHAVGRADSSALLQ